MEHRSRERLLAGLGKIRDSPRDGGRLVLMVRRPVVGERDLPGEAVLDQVAGLTGGNWLARGSKSTPGGSADPPRQGAGMKARGARRVAARADRRELGGEPGVTWRDLT